MSDVGAEKTSCLIMIINGSQELLELFQEILEEFGGGEYSCSLHALSSVHHVDAVREIQPELVMIDQPFNDFELRGWELVQKIRMARDLRDIPIIFTTTNVRLLQELEAQLMALNVRALVKPFDPENLIHQVRQALSDRGLDRIDEAAS